MIELYISILLFLLMSLVVYRRRENKTIIIYFNLLSLLLILEFLKFTSYRSEYLDNTSVLFVSLLGPLCLLSLCMRLKSKVAKGGAGLIHFFTFVSALILVLPREASIFVGLLCLSVFVFFIARVYFKYSSSNGKKFQDFPQFEILITEMVLVLLGWGKLLQIYFLRTESYSLIYSSFWCFLVLACFHKIPYEKAETETETDEQSTLELDYLKSVFIELDKIINSSELYKRQRLTLHELSTESGFSVRDISRAINIYANVGFNDYINGLRIKSFKESLGEGKFKHNILDLAFDVGFSSKTCFNNSFKRFYNCTPTEFINSCDSGQGDIL